MIEEIRYRDISADTADYDCADGEFSVCLNAVNEDGVIKRIEQPKEILKLQKIEEKQNQGLGSVSVDNGSEYVVYIHKTPNYTHYIIAKSFEYNASIPYKTLHWCDSSVTNTINKDDNSSNLSNLDTTELNSLIQITSIGNTLIVLTDEGMRYYLWQDNDYTYLGDRLPEISLSFGLRAQANAYTTTHQHSFNANAYDINGVGIDITAEQAMSEANTFIANLKKKGKFIFPFFVRYAYRLYDGSLTMHSAPVLMVCSSDVSPIFLATITGGGNIENGNRDYYASYSLHCVYCDLDYKVEAGSLSNWEDIIKSVDVFISSPIYTYDQNYKHTASSPLFDQVFKWWKIDQYNSTNFNFPYGIFAKHGGANYERWQHLDFIEDFYGNSFVVNYAACLPKRNDDDIKNDIENCSLFYFLHKIDVKDLQTERTIIPIKENYLNTLEVQEVMTDDYDSHDTIIPKFAHVYNSRLNLANIKKKLYNGGNLNSLFTFSNGTTCTYDIYFTIKQDGKEIIVKGEQGTLNANAPLLFVFYPNINATTATIVTEVSHGVFNKTTIPLKQHQLLNGAYAWAGWNGFVLTEEYPVISETDNTINLPNKIYTSEVNNPFYFPVANINTIGVGEILGMNTTTQALSQGQYGQFPLYIFATDGIWAVGVSQTGGFSNINPLTRDVCNNPNSITPIDNSILFVTEKGLMLLAGSQVICLTDRINNKHEYVTLGILKASGLDKNFYVIEFQYFLKGCSVIYDYKHQHIILFNNNKIYAYVYSLKSKTWGMIKSNLSEVVHSYPEAYAQTSDFKLVDFSQDNTTENPDIFLVTRPFKIVPNVHKTIRTLLQRGIFKKSDINQLLYGSNDLEHWHLIRSSKTSELRGFSGTPYKYFRLAIKCSNFTNKESLAGFSVEYIPKLTNRLR